MTTPQWIVSVRGKLGFTQAQLGAACGCHGQFVSNAERDVGPAISGMLNRMQQCEALTLTVRREASRRLRRHIIERAEKKYKARGIAWQR